MGTQFDLFLDDLATELGIRAIFSQVDGKGERMWWYKVGC
jgi:hypothetical protein